MQKLEDHARRACGSDPQPDGWEPCRQLRDLRAAGCATSATSGARDRNLTVEGRQPGSYQTFIIFATMRCDLGFRRGGSGHPSPGGSASPVAAVAPAGPPQPPGRNPKHACSSAGWIRPSRTRQRFGRAPRDPHRDNRAGRIDVGRALPRGGPSRHSVRTPTARSCHSRSPATNRFCASPNRVASPCSSATANSSYASTCAVAAVRARSGGCHSPVAGHLVEFSRRLCTGRVVRLEISECRRLRDSPFDQIERHRGEGGGRAQRRKGGRPRSAAGHRVVTGCRGAIRSGQDGGMTSRTDAPREPA
jgi:hypothetical protein